MAIADKLDQKTYKIWEFKQYPINLPPRKLPRSQSQRTPRLTIAAGAMIFAHNKILLDRSESNDLWSIPGGVVRFDESPQQGVIREIKEELGVAVEILPHQPFVFHFNLEAESSIDQIYLIHFLVKIKGEAKIVMGEQVVDYRWDSIGSHFRDCYPNVKPAVDYFTGLDQINKYN